MNELPSRQDIDAGRSYRASALARYDDHRHRAIGLQAKVKNAQRGAYHASSTVFLNVQRAITQQRPRISVGIRPLHHRNGTKHFSARVVIEAISGHVAARIERVMLTG